MSYDYLIVGAGLYGATFARLATDAGRRCLVIDKREHIAGNCYDYRESGILVNAYGGHIFHTNDERIWRFVNRFSDFSQYEHRVKVNYKGTIYSFPINLATLSQVYRDADTPEKGVRLLGILGDKLATQDDFEHYCLRTLGHDLYEMFFEGYTRKQWGCDPCELPASIAKRIPVRLTYDDRYFSDKFQGMPTEGYTAMVERMLGGVEVRLNQDFWEDDIYDNAFRRIVYSGPLDALFDYRFGKLEYRSLHFEHETLDIPDYQGCATINYTDEQIPYTRIIEWRHFRPDERHGKTVVTREYPSNCGEPYYPVENLDNKAIYERYRSLVPEWMLVGGRLGAYQYLNMDQAIGMAMKDVRRELC